jgi:predicted transcriptional regulator
MPDDAVLTVPLAPKLSRDLESLAAATKRSAASLAEEAIAQFVALQNWQRAKIEAGIAAADRGDFATDEALAAILKRHGVKA